MTLKCDWFGDDLRLCYRVYNRNASSYKTYVARIIGPHPDYYLDRKFEECWVNENSRWSSYTCLIDRNGVYEVVIKRFGRDGRFLSRERKWLFVCDGSVTEYDGGEMNGQYILYCVDLLKLSRKGA